MGASDSQSTGKLAAQPVTPLILASASPRRRALLRQIGIEVDAIDPAEIDEAPHRRELPRGYALRIALAKAEAVKPRHPGSFILAADTVVAIGRRILPKPADAASARGCLEALSGRRHKVMTALAVATPSCHTRHRVVTTGVRFRRLATREIEAYLESEEWKGKAGGYAVQGRAAVFVPAINGSYSNVVGLPLTETVALLRGLGYAW